MKVSAIVLLESISSHELRIQSASFGSTFKHSWRVLVTSKCETLHLMSDVWMTMVVSCHGLQSHLWSRNTQWWLINLSWPWHQTSALGLCVMTSWGSCKSLVCIPRDITWVIILSWDGCDVNTDAAWTLFKQNLFTEKQLIEFWPHAVQTQWKVSLTVSQIKLQCFGSCLFRFTISKPFLVSVFEECWQVAVASKHGAEASMDKHMVCGLECSPRKRQANYCESGWWRGTDVTKTVWAYRHTVWAKRTLKSMSRSLERHKGSVSAGPRKRWFGWLPSSSRHTRISSELCARTTPDDAAGQTSCSSSSGI